MAEKWTIRIWIIEQAPEDITDHLQGYEGGIYG